MSSCPELADPEEPVRDRWTRTDSWNFVSFCLGMLLENFVYGLSSVATGWVHEPATLRSLLLAWAPIWLIIGIAVAGPLADRIGRKSTFYGTMSLYLVGAIGLAFSDSYVLILLFLALLLFAAGGEMNTIMAATQEIMPTRHRSKASYIEFNFINVGGIILGAIAMGAASETVQRATLAGAVIVVLFVLLLARRRTPESIRWLESKGRDDQARAEAERYFGSQVYAARSAAHQAREHTQDQRTSTGASPRHRFALQLYATYSMALANAAGFGIVTYSLAPTFFPELVGLIIFISGVAEFTTGFFGLWADRIPRRLLLLIGFGGTFVFAVLFAALRDVWTGSFAVFVVLLVLFYIFVNVSFTSEDTFKSEIWPTRHRATYTALIRFLSIGSYIGTIFILQHLNLTDALYMNIALWAVGLVAAIIWRIFGRETGGGRSVSVSSAE